MKVLYENKEECLKILCSVSELLEECWKQPSFIPMLDKILISMINLKAILDANPQIEYMYRDVLEEEFKHFKKHEIPYINAFTGLVETISFKDARDDDKIAVITHNSQPTQKLMPNNFYVVINEAIGLIYINGEKAFCVKHAVEHSLRFAIQRWHTASENIKTYFEKL